MKEQWNARYALWVDAILAIAALVSLQWYTVDTSEWASAPYVPMPLQLLLLVTPLLIAVRRIVPSVALVGLAGAGYLAEYIERPPWFLYGGAVLALWSLTGRNAPRIAAPVLVGAAALPVWLTWQRSGESTERWPWQISALFVLLGLMLLVLRHKAERVPMSRQLAELWAFVRAGWIRDILLAATAASLILTQIRADLFRDLWWSAPAWMPYGVAAAGLSLAFRRRPVIPVVILAGASLLANWQADGSMICLYAAFGLALYWLVVEPKRMRSLRWTLPLAIAVVGLPILITRVMRVRYLQLIFPEIKRDGWNATIDSVVHNLTYDGIAMNLWPINLSVALLVPVVAGIVVRQVRRNREAARREAELEQAAEQLEAEQVVLTERAIIARDLHDVVAHAVNLMVIQAETGPDLVRRGEADVLAGFQRIGDAGRRALSELDRLLSTLRDENGIADPQLAPQPGLSELPQLVADVTSEQLPIELSVEGELSGVPEGQQVTGYRIVQEALTNVVKHAKATGVQVTVRSEEAGVRVEVTDDGVGFDVAAARRGNRHGLAGMRERVRIEGGTLDIRSTPGSGTTVAAWIPVGGGR